VAYHSLEQSQGLLFPVMGNTIWVMFVGHFKVTHAYLGLSASMFPFLGQMCISLAHWPLLSCFSGSFADSKCLSQDVL
jgi:hypothetical protein